MIVRIPLTFPLLLINALAAEVPESAMALSVFPLIEKLVLVKLLLKIVANEPVVEE